MPAPSTTVHVENPHHRLISLHAFLSAATITLASTATLGGYTLALEAGHGVIVGHSLLLLEGDSVYQGRATVVVSNTITVDTPLNKAYTASATAYRGSTNMNLDGSSAVKEFFVQAPPGAGINIHRYIVYAEDQVAMDTAKYGGIAALTVGTVIAKRNAAGVLIEAQQAVRSNGEWAERAFDVGYDDNAPAGYYGFRCRRTWGGLDKSGSALHLAVGEKLVVLVQDDLTGLDAHRIVFQGHYTEE